MRARRSPKVAFARGRLRAAGIAAAIACGLVAGLAPKTVSAAEAGATSAVADGTAATSADSANSADSAVVTAAVPAAQVDEATGVRPNAFGNPNWVAPNAGAFTGDPTAAGPRVAERDHEPTGEKILRAPFRLAFLPVRWVARGTESLVSFAGPWFVSPPSTIPTKPPRTTIGPAFLFSGWTGLQAGVGVTHRFDSQGNNRMRMQGTWSTRDHRLLRVRQNFDRADQSLGLELEARYWFRPTSRFYGLGNATNRVNRSIYLDEGGRLEAAMRVGKSYKNNLSLIASYLGNSARVGYNDSPGVLDVFSPEEAEQLFGSNQLFGLGIAAEMEKISDMRDPTSGVHGIVEVRQYKSTDGGGLEFREWHVEGRAYVPVFAKRRVLAFRAVHENVDPMDGSAPIPISLMPDPTADLRFTGYRSHRFRDRHLIFGQLEYRWLVWRRLWAMGIAQMGEVASDSKSIRIADVHESYGGGLRYAFNEETTGRLEIANGTEGTYVYVTIRGTF